MVYLYQLNMGYQHQEIWKYFLRLLYIHTIKYYCQSFDGLLLISYQCMITARTVRYYIQCRLYDKNQCANRKNVGTMSAPDFNICDLYTLNFQYSSGFWMAEWFKARSVGLRLGRLQDSRDSSKGTGFDPHQNILLTMLARQRVEETFSGCTF